MPDEQGESTEGSWEWDRPFDDDFVRGAAVREDSGHARAERAMRIATEHTQAESWRADRPHLDTRHRGGRPPSGPRRSRVFSLVLVLLAVGGLFLASVAVLSKGDSAAPGTTTAAGGQGVPNDAQPTRLLPLPTEVPGDGGYRLQLVAGTPGDVRWDPCRPIHYVTRAGGSPRGGSALVQDAFDRLSAATGLSFVSDGVTTEGPTDGRAVVQERYGDRFAPVLVSWSTERESPLLKGNIAAYAGAVPGDDGRGLRLVSGEVVLDAPTFARLRSRDEGMAILLHELGHLVGLDHVTDPQDTMYSESGDGAPLARYTPGAARGLRLLGSGPCFS